MKINMPTHEILKLVDYSDIYFMFNHSSQEFKIIVKKKGEQMEVESSTLSSILDKWDFIFNFEKEDFIIDLYAYNKKMCRYRTHKHISENNIAFLCMRMAQTNISELKQTLIIEEEKERFETVINLNNSIDKKIKL